MLSFFFCSFPFWRSITLHFFFCWRPSLFSRISNLNVIRFFFRVVRCRIVNRWGSSFVFTRGRRTTTQKRTHLWIITGLLLQNIFHFSRYGSFILLLGWSILICLYDGLISLLKFYIFSLVKRSIIYLALFIP